MEEIKKWTLLISAVAVISGVLLSVLPEGKLKKAYKTLTGVILVYAFLYPLVSGHYIGFTMNEFLSDNYEISENIDKYALSAIISSAQKAIKELIESELEKKSIESKVTVQCTESGGEIKVTSVSFLDDLSDTIKSKVIDICLSFGIDKDIIKFTGESDEQ